MGREWAFGLGGLSYREKILFANANVRTLSRVIVHPQFRSIGLASLLVREVCRGAETRYVEALAVMGRVHPFFERGGMRRVAVPGDADGGPVYFLYDGQGLAMAGGTEPSPRPSP
jgi:ABC-type ATPase with predicted acetyltransferase domain